MNRWHISFPIDGLHDVIKESNSELTIDNVKFHYQENQRVSSITVDADKQNEAEKEAAYQIDKSLSKVCFAYNTEASIDISGFYITDLSKNPHDEYVVTSLGIRSSYVKGRISDLLYNIGAAAIHGKS